MSAAGYIGDSFGKQWVRACAALDENPDRNILIFVDEVDKLFAQTHTSRERAQPSTTLLKPLEGGILEGSDDSRNGTPYALDCDRCIFVMAGAFTGIEDIIASRIGIRVRPSGSAPPQKTPLRERPSEDGLRERVSLEDVETWGHAARDGGTSFHSAFPCGFERRGAARDRQTQQAKRIRPHASCGRTLFHRYRSRGCAGGKRAPEAHYGRVPSINAINDVFFRRALARWQTTHPVASVTLTARNGELDFDIEQGRAKRDARTRPSTL